MPDTNPSSIHAGASMIEQGLAYIGIFFGGFLGTKGLDKIRNRANGRGLNGKTTLADVVVAIHQSGEKTRTTIISEGEKNRACTMADGEKTRQAMMRIPECVKAAHDKTIAALEKASDDQACMCRENRDIARDAFAALNEMRKDIEK